MTVNWPNEQNPMWGQDEQETVFRVFVPAFTTGMAPEFIRKGFENTGIYPPNAEALKLQNIQASAVYDRCKSI